MGVLHVSCIELCVFNCKNWYKQVLEKTGENRGKQITQLLGQKCWKRIRMDLPAWTFLGAVDVGQRAAMACQGHPAGVQRRPAKRMSNVSSFPTTLHAPVLPKAKGDPELSVLRCFQS